MAEASGKVEDLVKSCEKAQADARLKDAEKAKLETECESIRFQLESCQEELQEQLQVAEAKIQDSLGAQKVAAAKVEELRKALDDAQRQLSEQQETSKAELAGLAVSLEAAEERMKEQLSEAQVVAP